MYKKAYQELLCASSEAIDSINKIMMEYENEHMRERLHELHEKLVSAIQKAEAIIIESNEEI